MKRIIFAPVLAIIVVGFISQQATNALEDGPSATGGFHFVLEDGNTRFLQFHARVHGETARGSMTFSDPNASVGSEDAQGTPTGVQITADFDCMRIEENRAVMGGTITSSNILEAIGNKVLLVVEDNGEGTLPAAPDRLTWGVYGSAATGWVPKDAERDDDNGASLSWIATDFERPDDVGIPSNRSNIVGCQTFPLAAFSFVDIGHGSGNLQVRR